MPEARSGSRMVLLPVLVAALGLTPAPAADEETEASPPRIRFVDTGQALGDANSVAAALADFDRDGDLDALVVNQDAASRIWWNDGRGRFAAAGDSLATAAADSLPAASAGAAGDLNGDGAVDLLLINGPSGSQTWLNDGRGRFSARELGLPAPGATHVALGDLDQDGDADALVTYWEDRPREIWWNEGDGRFRRGEARLPGAHYAAMTLLVDLDRDGDIDAFACDKATRRHAPVPNHLFLNDGRGRLTEQHDAFPSACSQAAAAADFDGDGDLDLFVANTRHAGADPANWMLWNEGARGWRRDPARYGNAYSLSAAAGDLDGDGDIDVWVGNYQEGDRILLNDGAGGLSDAALALGDANTAAVALGDLDRDGDLDALAAHNTWQAGSGVNRIYRNDGVPPIAVAPAAPELGAEAAAGQAWQGTIRVRDGVEQVLNPRDPLRGTRRYAIVERWRVGGEELEPLLGVISDVEMDEAGRIYLLDRQLAQVVMLSPEGELLNELGREGDGPGEFRFPIDLFLLADGRVGVAQARPAKVVYLDRAGLPAGSFALGEDEPGEGGMQMLLSVLSRGDQLVLISRAMQRRADGVERTFRLARYGSDGLQQQVLLERTQASALMHRRYVERDEYFVHRGRCALGPNGRVYAATERDRYAIAVFDSAGECERVIAREFEPWPRSAEEQARVGQGLVMRVRGRRVRPEVIAEPHEPAITQLHVDPNGQLWVLSARGHREQPAGVFATYDLFDRRGRFVERAAILADAEADRDRIHLLGADTVVLVKHFAAAAQSLFGDAGDGMGAGPETADEAEEAAPLEVIVYRRIVAP